MNPSSGYRHANYARAFSGVAEPLRLENCDGWLLKRPTPMLPFHDAMGCYPLFACTDWTALGGDLGRLSGELVSLCLVTDPFGDFKVLRLSESFDTVQEFKPHWIVDLESPASLTLPRKHRRNVDKSLDRVSLELCMRPVEWIVEWDALYQTLRERHGISGSRSFSRESLLQQLTTPGLVMIRASVDGVTVGLHLWMTDLDVAYGHLGATSSQGYAVGASYALYWFAREHFRGKVRWLDLGSSPGLDNPAGHGLDRFKRGWATGERPTFFCSRIFDQGRYDQLRTANPGPKRDYFPEYRNGEFASGEPRN